MQRSVGSTGVWSVRSGLMTGMSSIGDASDLTFCCSTNASMRGFFIINQPIGEYIVIDCSWMFGLQCAHRFALVVRLGEYRRVGDFDIEHVITPYLLGV